MYSMFLMAILIFHIYSLGLLLLEAEVARRRLVLIFIPAIIPPLAVAPPAKM